MATEKRLIDANAMRQHWLENGENEYVYDTNSVLDSIDEQPTVDAVEVVRCKDCIYAKNNYLVPGLCLCEKTIHNAVTGDMPRNTIMTEDDFCSYGERKDNGTSKT